jgi:hypothetical protein
VAHVFIVPDGALQFVNWDTMPVDGDRYLVELGPLISYLSAERDLVDQAPHASGFGLLAIGAPDYDADPVFTLADSGGSSAPAPAERYRGARTNCTEFRAAHWDQLPGARSELDDVVAAWRYARPGGVAGASANEPALELAGRGATESAFVEHGPGRRMIHLATHAFFTGSLCASSPGERGIGAMVAVAPGMPTPAKENPLLLSGLVFAGANRHGVATPDQDDGILTAEEIAALDLSGVEWAVLSGCGTGVGAESPGEGVLGLRRAFRVAGVRTLILSLWSVGDRATRDWMRKLYSARLERGLGTSESVRQACLETLGTLRARHLATHPSTWGAFIAIGDWR